MKTAMKHLETADCEPTLTDTEVIEFCKKGFLMLEGVVPREINRRAFDFIDTHGHVPIRGEEWFMENVLLNREAAGAVRSLLGANFGMPIGVANHRVECPNSAQGWHRDGGSTSATGASAWRRSTWTRRSPRQPPRAPGWARSGSWATTA